jgi:hypothetical protein
MDICLFWLGRRLRPVDLLCIASMVRTGQAVRLFSYEPVENLPKGVISHDAREVMSDAYLPLVTNKIWTTAQLSDFFRVMLMRDQRGAWLDTDTYIFEPFSPDPTKPFLAWEDHHRLGVSAMYFPSVSPVIPEFETYLADFMAGKVLLPDWLGFRRRVARPLWFKMTGKKITPYGAGFTIYGNDGITRLAKRHGFISEAARKETFYYWSGKACARIYEAGSKDEILSCPHAIGIHFADKKKHRFEQPVAPGSFFEWAKDRVGFSHAER